MSAQQNALIKVKHYRCIIKVISVKVTIFFNPIAFDFKRFSNSKSNDYEVSNNIALFTYTYKIIVQKLSTMIRFFCYNSFLKHHMGGKKKHDHSYTNNITLNKCDFDIQKHAIGRY